MTKQEAQIIYRVLDRKPQVLAYISSGKYTTTSEKLFGVTHEYFTWGCAWKVEKMFVWPAAAERRKASQSLADGKSVLCARASLYTLAVSLIFAAEVSYINSTFPACSVDFPLNPGS